MSADTKAPRRPKRASLSPITPAVLSEPDAALYLGGKSQSWLRKRRFDDLAAIRRGEEPTGPLWIQVETSILYRVADLDAWLSSKAIERGTCEFRGHRRADDERASEVTDAR